MANSNSSEKNPKQRLHEFYQTVRSKPPTFDYQSGPPPPAPPAFLCTVKIDAVTYIGGEYAAQEFSAEGASKKMAMHAACSKALEFIESKGLIRPVATAQRQAQSEQALALAAAGALQQSGVEASPADPPPEPTDVEARIVKELGGKSIDQLTPEELRLELEKALQKNTQSKAGLHHDEQRRQKAAAYLLGLSSTLT